jgi:two-component system sensor histidine kinase KdpD
MLVLFSIARHLSNGTISRVRITARRRILQFAIATAIDLLIVLVYFKLLHVNQTTVGFTFLLGILAVSAVWGLSCAIYMSLISTLAYNYFFLPPILEFTISDPQNWVALFTFLVTAVLASQLSERARRQALEANQRRSEVDRLYAFSQQLLVTEDVRELLNVIPRYIVESFSVAGCALFLEGKPDAYYSGLEAQSALPAEQLKTVAGRGEPVVDHEHLICYMPLHMGVRSVGSLGLRGSIPSRETLEALGSLIATAIERAATMEKLNKAEGARESERLRSVLLDAVTHEFRTPLTSIKASAETLLSGVEIDPAQRSELLNVINEESDRLNRLIGEATEVAQLDARTVELHIRPYHVREAVDTAIEISKPALSRHPLEVYIPDNLPTVPMDVDRIAEVLQQLLDNAAKYSPPGTPIRITAELREPVLVVSVADHGAGVEDMEQAMIFERFYRGRNQRVSIQGTGMGLAIVKAIVELHGGTVGVTSQLGRGSVFNFTLPLRS